MRVLMLGWELPPHNSGGLGVACLELTKALAASGADIEFVLPYYSGAGFEHMKVTSAFTKPQDYSSFTDPYDSKSYELAVGSAQTVHITDQEAAFEDAVSYLATSREFDVIHAHDWLTFRAALRAKWDSGKPLVVHIHSIERDRAGGGAGSPIVRDIEGTAMMIADRVIAVSEHTKKMIIEDYGIPADKISVVHNSVNPEDFLPLEQENDYHYLSLMRTQGWKVLVYVGRITIQKGLTHFLQAAAQALQREPKTFILLIGSGEQRDELIELAANLGIGDRLLLADFQRGKRLRDGFNAADLFVMPSVSEPFGLVALEAVGYGTPVLVSKQSGVSEVLKSCLKVDYWDENEMTNQITSVLRNPSLASELTINGAKELEQLSWRKPAQNVMDIYYRHAGGVAA